MYNMPKEIKGEKYIYLLMAAKLCKQSKESIAIIGNDNGYTGGQNFYRVFKLLDYDGQTLLVETKNNKSFADLSRCFVINGLDKEGSNSNTTVIREYFNEAGENCSKHWVH